MKHVGIFIRLILCVCLICVDDFEELFRLGKQQMESLFLWTDYLVITEGLIKWIQGVKHMQK